MEERIQNLQADAGKASDDPEKTLVAPRFDAREVVTAQPVVPLADSHAPRRARRQGTLPVLLILVSALVGGLVSVFAYRLYQQRVEQSSAREQQQQPATVEAPALTPEIPDRARTNETPADAPEVIEEPMPDAEVAEVRDAATREETAEREEARDDRAGRDSGEAREARPAPRDAATRRPTARRVEEITTPTEDLGVRRDRYDGKEASDYEVPRRTRAERRAERRAARRAARRNERQIDRVRAIFEGPPPTR
jgi:hypothetical protein